ncbi:hypothetical protein Cni_G23314 [Canna indica]|uniref:Protein E6-like n=1 Tax=Canna indica TaxID=4628 RepID=A0AAQ3QKC6_9LILI|nr:hypothetical protein Cni_G23314 [Canna indica]
MASSSPQQMPLLFFLLFLAFSPIQIRARESRFFSKTTRDPPKELAAAAAAPSKEETTTKKEHSTPLLPPQTHSGYGLYGRRPDHFFPATVSSSYGTYNYDGGRRDNSFQSAGLPAAGTELSGEKFENEELNAVHNNGKQWRPYNSNPSKFSNEYGTTAAATTTTEWSNEVEPSKQYSYDVNGGRNQFEYNSQSWRGNPEGYGVYNYGGRTGNYGSGYEHSNAMNDEYQSREENQEDFDP